MFYVYVIKSIKADELYFGFTKDLKRRLQEHNEKKNFSTQSDAPWKLIYYEAFLSEKDAKKREYRLKRFGSSYSQLKKRISQSDKMI